MLPSQLPTHTAARRAAPLPQVRDAEELAAAHFNATRSLLNSELRILEEEARAARKEEEEVERAQLAEARARAESDAERVRLQAEREAQARIAAAEAHAAEVLRRAELVAATEPIAHSQRLRALQRAQRTSVGSSGASTHRTSSSSPRTAGRQSSASTERSHVSV